MPIIDINFNIKSGYEISDIKDLIVPDKPDLTYLDIRTALADQIKLHPTQLKIKSDYDFAYNNTCHRRNASESGVTYEFDILPHSIKVKKIDSDSMSESYITCDCKEFFSYDADNREKTIKKSIVRQMGYLSSICEVGEYTPSHKSNLPRLDEDIWYNIYYQSNFLDAKDQSKLQKAGMEFMSLLTPLSYDYYAVRRSISPHDDAVCTLIEDLREEADRYYSSEQSNDDKSIFINSYQTLINSAKDNPLLNQNAFWGHSVLLVIARFFVTLAKLVSRTPPLAELRFFDSRPVMVKKLEETLATIDNLAGLQEITQSPSA